jgi:glutathione S-transferase
VRVYGSKISYYTGKLESYLRYKEVGYESLPLAPHGKAIKLNTGTLQMPAVERDDGRWMSDSTPIIAQLEKEYPEAPVIPSDPVVRFIALLMEDYADEWLWRPAMHYRWSYRDSRELAASVLAAEQTKDIPLPGWLKRQFFKSRQRIGFVVRDGVCDATWDHVEAGYFAALDNMTCMLKRRRFLLGDAPSVADFGLMAPMFRHFSQDPTPLALMLNRAPDVFAWVSRMWNAKATTLPPEFVDVIPTDAAPMLKEISETHLHQLAANAEAYKSGMRQFSMRVQGFEYVKLPVSRYRVACLEALREGYSALAEEQKSSVQALLPHPEAGILWDPDFCVRSGYDEEKLAPFNKAINVYGTGVPRS